MLSTFKTMVSDIRRSRNIWRKYGTKYISALTGVSLRNFGIVFLNAFFSSKIAGQVIEGTGVGENASGWIALTAAIILFCVFDALSQYFLHVIAHQLITHTRKTMTHCVVNADMRYLGRETDRADYISRVNNDLDLVHGVLRYQVLSPIMSAFSGILAAVSLFFIDQTGMLVGVSFITGLLFLGGMSLITKRIEVLRNRISIAKSEITKFLDVCLEKKESVLLCGHEEYLQDKIDERNQVCMDMELKKDSLDSIITLLGKAPLVTQYGIGLAICAVWFSRGNISIPEILVALPMMGMVVNTLISFGDVYKALAESWVGVKRVIEILELPQEREDISKQRSVQTDNSIIVKDLCFSYPKAEEDILNGINLRVAGPGLYGVSGESGKGKSTLMKLLMGLYPFEGELSVFGNQISDYSRTDFQELISYVGQEAFWIGGTIEENLLLDMDMSERNDNPLFERWIGMLGGTERVLGEGESGLSGGELQLLSIMRALIKTARIRIFDESLSALDKEMKNDVLETLSDDAKTGTIVFIISHDEQVLSACQKVIRI
ncbi:MAG: ABC transporter ATP-binding protein [Lachnospiraceae bacterium]|nr:ABC transporter ATP-binding protein [Lachnospiraceae bacterium]